MFDALVDARRLPALVRTLTSLLPLRVYPILDVLGADEYREIDPYIAYDLVGLDRFLEGVRVFGTWLFEDGLVGFGAMSIEPFVYLFVDEHKIVTVRVQLDLKDQVEKILGAFDLKAVEEVKGADAVAHEHRTVLANPEEVPEAITGEEIVERLRHDWAMQLNVAGDTNVDDDGRDLGVTGWRCLARCLVDEGEPERFAEVLLAADSLDNAEQLALGAVAPGDPEDPSWLEIDLIACDRVKPERFGELVGAEPGPILGSNGVVLVRWLDPDPQPEPDERDATA
jgi:hypothetical protein